MFFGNLTTEIFLQVLKTRNIFKISNLSVYIPGFLLCFLFVCFVLILAQYCNTGMASIAIAEEMQNSMFF